MWSKLYGNMPTAIVIDWLTVSIHKVSLILTLSGTSGRVGVTCFITYDIMGMITISWGMKKEKRGETNHFSNISI